MNYSQFSHDCSCGQHLRGTYITKMGYIFTCVKCGKTYRGGFWIRTWLFKFIPRRYIIWRNQQRLRRFLRREVEEAVKRAYS